MFLTNSFFARVCIAVNGNKEKYSYINLKSSRKNMKQLNDSVFYIKKILTLWFQQLKVLMYKIKFIKLGLCPVWLTMHLDGSFEEMGLWDLDRTGCSQTPRFSTGPQMWRCMSYPSLGFVNDFDIKNNMGTWVLWHTWASRTCIWAITSSSLNTSTPILSYLFDKNC